jgi:hypothetical protein
VARSIDGVQKSTDGADFDLEVPSSSAATTPPPLPPRTPPALPGQKKPGPQRVGIGIVSLLLAAAAFLLPVAGAGTFAALKWHRSGSAAGDGDPYVAMDISSKGVSCVQFEVFADDDYGYDFRLIDEQSLKTELAADLGKTGEFSPTGVKKAAQVIKTFHDLLTKEKKVPPGHIFLAGSSGLMAPIRDRKDLSPAQKKALIARNKKLLADRIKEEVGLEVDFVEQHEEALYNIEGLIRSRDLDVGLYLDVGSGGTRCGYRDRSGAIKNMRVGGVTAFRGSIETMQKRNRNLALPELASRVAAAELRPALRAQIKKQPDFMEREKVYLVGGITWVMATCQHPERCVARRGQYVKLTTRDIEEFRKNVAKPGHYLKKYQPPEGLNLSPEQKKELEKTLKKQAGFFPTREHLVAGAEILYALAQELELERKTVWFHRNGHIAWLQSYIEEQGGLK